MKAYIINLKRSVKRRRDILAQAEEQGLDFEIVEAIDGGAVPPQELHKLADMAVVMRHRSWLSDRTLATALSHRRAYEKFLEDGGSTALIIEDDALLFDGIAAIAQSAADVLIGPEIALLHYVSFAPLGLSAQNSARISADTELMYPMTLDGVGSAAAYLVTRDGAQSLVDKVIPVRSASDSWNDFVAFGYLDRVRMVYPEPAGVIGAKSNISIEGQNRIRFAVTQLADRYQIPILSSFFRNQRLKTVRAMSQFFVTDERSPFDL